MVGAGVRRGSEKVWGGREDADGSGNAVDGHERRTETQRCFLLTTRSGEEGNPVKLYVHEALNKKVNKQKQFKKVFVNKH